MRWDLRGDARLVQGRKSSRVPARDTRTVVASSEDIVNAERWRDVNLPLLFQNKESPRDAWTGYLEGDLAVSGLVMSCELSVNINSRQEKIRRIQISVLNPDSRDSEGFISVGTLLLGALNVFLSASCWLEYIVRYLHANVGFVDKISKAQCCHIPWKCHLKCVFCLFVLFHNYLVMLICQK